MTRDWKEGDYAQTEAHGLVVLGKYAHGWWEAAGDGWAGKLRTQQLQAKAKVSTPSVGEIVAEVEEQAEYKQAGKVKFKPARYVRGLGETANGNQTYDIGDDVASALRSLDLGETYSLATAWLSEYDVKVALTPKLRKDFEGMGLGDWEPGNVAEFLDRKYSHLNRGMQRMNLGNLMRGAQRRALKQG